MAAPRHYNGKPNFDEFDYLQKLRIMDESAMTAEDRALVHEMIPTSQFSVLMRKPIKYIIGWLLKKKSSYLQEQADRMASGMHISCAECGYTAKTLFGHIKSAHGISATEYREKYGDSAKTACNTTMLDLSRRFKEKNPNVGKCGKQSPFSTKFIGYVDLTTEEKLDRISKLKIRATESTVPEKRTNRVEYYTSRGMDSEAAKLAVSRRQATFSLSRCVEEHGLMPGTKIWMERQNRWQATIYAKSDEEIQELNRKKLNKNGTSASERRLFLLLSEIYKNVERQHCLQYKDGDKSRWFVYDIRIGNVLIEYNGDFWHRNPNSSADYIDPDYFAYGMLTSEVWAKDLKKRKLAEATGFILVTVWESEYINDPDTILNEIHRIIEMNNHGNEKTTGL